MIRWLPAIGWAATIWWLSSGPLPAELPPAIPHADKLAHLAAFGLLAALVAWAPRELSPGARGWLGLLVAAACGAIDEWHQSWVPGRSADIADWIADVAGGLVVWLVYRSKLQP